MCACVLLRLSVCLTCVCVRVAETECVSYVCVRACCYLCPGAQMYTSYMCIYVFVYVYVSVYVYVFCVHTSLMNIPGIDCLPLSR